MAVEQIHIRLREELDRMGLSAAQAARNAGLPDSQGLRDVLAGRKRLAAELLAQLAHGAGIDAAFVVTGQRDYEPPPPLSAEEQVFLDYFRKASPETRRAALGALIGASAEDSKRQPRHQVDMRGATLNNDASGGVQVGYAAGKVKVTGRR